MGEKRDEAAPATGGDDLESFLAEQMKNPEFVVAYEKATREAAYRREHPDECTHPSTLARYTDDLQQVGVWCLDCEVELPLDAPPVADTTVAAASASGDTE